MNYAMTRIIDANANAALCGPCGGKCCQKMPGNVFPVDIDANMDDSRLYTELRAMMDSGKYTLDYFIGDPFAVDPSLEDRLKAIDTKTFYLRPAVKGQEGDWLADNWTGGVCTFHSAAGCTLPELKRPTECRALIPRSESKCSMPEGWEGHRAAAKAWWPHQHLLLRFYDEYLNRE